MSRCDDKRVAIDLAIIKQCLGRTKPSIRWAPTNLQLADAFTKDKIDPSDLIRAALDIGEDQLNDEASVLVAEKRHREYRNRVRSAQEATEAENKRKKSVIQ